MGGIPRHGFSTFLGDIPGLVWLSFMVKVSPETAEFQDDAEARDVVSRLPNSLKVPFYSRALIYSQTRPSQDWDPPGQWWDVQLC